MTRLLLASALSLSCLLSAPSAHAEGPPPDPTPYLLSGSIMGAVGLAGLGTIALCKGHGPTGVACIIATPAASAGFVAAAIPLLVIGVKRVQKNDALTKLSVSYVPGGGAVTWAARF